MYIGLNLFFKKKFHYYLHLVTNKLSLEVENKLNKTQRTETRQYKQYISIVSQDMELLPHKNNMI